MCELWLAKEARISDTYQRSLDRTIRVMIMSWGLATHYTHTNTDRPVEENVLLDQVLTAHGAKDCTRLLRIQTEVVNQVARDGVEARLVSTCTIDPDSFSRKANALRKERER